MIARCHNPKHPSYKDYGARGITVCDEWRHSFESFFNYFGPQPEQRTASGRAAYSIERINNDAGYCPGNIRWATQKEQMNNTRQSKNKKARKRK